MAITITSCIIILLSVPYPGTFGVIIAKGPQPPQARQATLTTEYDDKLAGATNYLYSFQDLTKFTYNLRRPEQDGLGHNGSGSAVHLVELASAQPIGITVSKFVCGEHQIYDGDIHGCRINCTDQQTYDAATNSCSDAAANNGSSPSSPSSPSSSPHTTAAPIKSRRKSDCKKFVIDSAEFNVSSDGTLIVTDFNVTFPSGNYTIESGGAARVCYPFSQHFLTCKLWGIYPQEYELKRHGLQLLLKSNGVVYGPGDFYVKPDRSGGMCVNDNPDDERNLASIEWVAEMYAICWAISAASMLVTLLVYTVGQKIKHHTRLMICHMISLLVTYVVLLVRVFYNRPDKDVCITYGLVVHYFFLAAFFWMNVLAYDIWKRFPSLHLKDLNGNECRRFALISLYAWGCPLVVVISAVVSDYYLDEGSSLKPNYKVNCWLATNYAKLAFFTGPMAVLLATNLIFFALTVHTLRSFGKDAALVNKHINNQLFKMYIKLMIVMGLCWVMELVSWAVGPTGDYFWVTDIINSLQGFFLFVIYVCKPSVLKGIIRSWERHFGPCSWCPTFLSCLSPRQRVNCTQSSEASTRCGTANTSGRTSIQGSGSLCSIPTSENSFSNATQTTRLSANM